MRATANAMPEGRHRCPKRAIVLLGMMLAIACAGPAGTGTPAGAPTAAATQTAAAHDAAAKAVADLSQRIAVEPASIQIISIEPHTWPDTSLGLPQPGQTYAQVETSGYIVTLGYVRQAFVYHVAGDIVRFDQQASAPVPSGTPF